MSPTAKYERTWVTAEPQHFPGDIENHIVLTTVAPAGNVLVSAIVNLQNAFGNVELWLDVGNAQRQQAVITSNGFASVSFGAEVAKGGQTIAIELRSGVPLDIGPNTQLVFTTLP
jgi:hypothetical protein